MKRFLFLIIVCAFFFTSCVEPTPKVEPVVKVEPTPTPEPEPEPEPTVPSVAPAGISFFDNDLSANKIGGSITVNKASDEEDVKSYIVYWGGPENVRLTLDAIKDVSADGQDIIIAIANGTSIPVGADRFLAYTKNAVGLCATPVSIVFDDRYLVLSSSTISSEFSNPRDLKIYGDELYFIASKQDSEDILMRKNVPVNSEISYCKSITLFDGALYFQAKKGDSQNLWRTTLSSGLTEAVKPDMNNYFAPEHICVLGASIYFAATDASSDRELWSYNGTLLSRKSDINTTGASSPRGLTALSPTTIIFSAETEDYGRELWKTDGINTTLVKDCLVGMSGSNPSDFIAVQNKIVFTADSMHYGRELWVTDGTDAGTKMLKDIRNGTMSSEMKGFYRFNNIIYFTADDGNHGRELWRTDGTEAGTVMVLDINSAGSSNPSNFFGNNGVLYFSADNNVGCGLWISDDNGVSARVIEDLGCNNPGNFAMYNGFLYFSAETFLNGRELFVMDITKQVAVLLSDIQSAGSSSPRDLIVHKGKLLFSAEKTVGKREFFEYKSADDLKLFN